MSIIVSLLAYTPPARADSLPFTKARIEEAATAAGPWTAIQTITLAPVDTDPEHPESRDFTTNAATIASGGFYRVTWIDALDNLSSPSAPVENADELAGGVRPTVTDVAALLRARTKERGTGGKEAGTFNANTRPTAEDADFLISEAVHEVLGKVQAPEGEGSDYEKRVRGAIALYAAILVETSYFPEQANAGNGQSVAAIYQALYDKRIKSLIAEGEAGEVTGEGGEGASGGSPAQAYYGFPQDLGGQLGLSTRF